MPKMALIVSGSTGSAKSCTRVKTQSASRNCLYVLIQRAFTAAGGPSRCRVLYSGCRTKLGWRSSRTCPGTSRSEEHTSELQSLMRISYAVFCLKKKTKNTTTLNTTHNSTTLYQSSSVKIYTLQQAM